jgi:hypothetical protein
MPHDQNTHTPDERDGLAVQLLNNVCGPLRAWMIMRAGNVYRCVIQGSTEKQHEGDSIESAVLGAMRAADLLK